MEVFEAVGDPVRREILAALGGGTLSAGEIAGLFAISRPAVSRHLRVLRESGLVRDEVSGRRRLYRLVPAGLDPLLTWLAEVTPAGSWQDGPVATASNGPAWTSRLDALETEVRRTRRARHQTDRADAATEHPPARRRPHEPDTHR